MSNEIFTPEEMETLYDSHWGVSDPVLNARTHSHMQDFDKALKELHKAQEELNRVIKLTQEMAERAGQI